MLIDLLPNVIVDNLDYLLWGRLREGQPGGLLLTVVLAVCSGALALVSGLALGIACWLGPRWLGRVLWLAGELVRGIPLLLLMFWLFFLTPLLLGQGIAGWISVVLALALFNAFSVMQTLRSALEGLPKGQAEAALAAGFSPWQSLRWVLLPQVLRQIVPSLVNLLVALIKDTSLAFVVSVPELTMLSSQVNNREQVYPLQIFLFAGLAYFALCSLLSGVAGRLERRLV